MGSSARELILVMFFSDFGEEGHTAGFMGRLDSGYIVHFHFFGLYQEFFCFCLYCD